ncbi:MAG: metallophosphoesterase [Anaerolineales bacterium]|nr:metallophosphoesterase [Anaerolineales bacterium]
MRIAVFSDIHGNPFACNAVLDEIKSTGPYDCVVAAGDLLFGGSDPAVCADMLMDARVSATFGNTEEYILYPERTPPDVKHSSKWDVLKPVTYWIREKLNNEHLTWLSQLPLSRIYAPNDNPGDALLVCHANPVNNETFIYPSPAVQKKLFGEVKQPDNHPELNDVLAGEESNCIAFGHFHYSFLRQWKGKKLTGVAPVSIAPYDLDLRARYSEFIWDSDQWKIQQHFVRYDYSKEFEALSNTDIPEKKGWLEIYIKVLGVNHGEK